ncbi:MAG: IS200/IS605 family transposase, partial [Methanolobus sp.]|nr:IS200/IS605 family transposase [Methanolobus sp.]
MNTWESKNRHKYLLQYHLILVCKYRKKLLNEPIRTDIIKLFEDICKKQHTIIKTINTDNDHIHYLLETGPTVTVSKLISTLKS